MSNVRVFVGLDYHQDSVQVCVLNEQGDVLCNRSVANNASAICRAVANHGDTEAAALEACCGAADLAQELIGLGWSVSLAHPGSCLA